MKKLRKSSKSLWPLPPMPIPLKSPVWKVSATADLENKLSDPIFCFRLTRKYDPEEDLPGFLFENIVAAAQLIQLRRHCEPKVPVPPRA